MMKPYVIQDVREALTQKYQSSDFVIDKSGQKVIELIGVTFVADEETIFGTPNYEYIQREIDWYRSQSLNVNDIPGKIPKIWKDVADKDGFINSNYGYLIWSDGNYNQFNHVRDELIANPDSRRAEMIYTRPSIWNEYNENGRSDFICTEAVQYFIRKNRLITHVKMRSNDVVFGTRNDLAWQRYVQHELWYQLEPHYSGLQLGEIIWSVGSLHLYENHFYLIDHYIHTGEISIDRRAYDEQHKVSS